MKKIIIAAAALIAMTACNKNIIEVSNPEAGFGYLELGVTANEEIVVTKAGEEVNTDGYTVTVSNTEGVVETKLYSDIKENGWKLAAGTYTLKAENITADKIYETNDKGEAYIAGEKEITITAGVVSEETIECTVKNAKVAFQYTQDFLDVFPTSVLNVSCGEKTFENLGMLLTTAEDYSKDNLESVFFMPGTVTWTLDATKKDSTVKNYTKTFDVAAATWTIVTFSVGSTDGTVKITIDVDGTITEYTIDAVLDPIEGNINQGEATEVVPAA